MSILLPYIRYDRRCEVQFNMMLKILQMLRCFLTHFILAMLYVKILTQSALSRAWEETFPGHVPFWEKYTTGPHGVVIRGWQFSRCASEQVRILFQLTATVLQMSITPNVFRN